ncbi:MAG: FtsX-like permease family protein, partial [Candidatus Aminicenantes bacterium]
WGAKDRIRIFSVIAIFVLLIACINFVNLTTARSAQRAKEVGLRKVVGAHRKQLIKQFFGESLLLTVLALFMALICIVLCLPVVRNLTGKPLTMAYLSGAGIVAGILGITLLTGILSGIYPSLCLSSAQPVQILKGCFHSGAKGSLFRKILVVIQFVFSIILVVSTTVVQRQVRYMRNMNLGFEKEQMLYLQLRGNLRSNFEAAGSELLKNSGIQHVTFASRPPTFIGTNGRNWEWEGRDPNVNPLVTYMAVYPNFLETFGVELLDGQFFQEGQRDKRFVVINQRFAEIIGLDSPVGRSLRQGMTEFEIKGVVNNFHFQPLHYEIGPMMLYYGTMGSFLDYRFMFIKVSPENMSSTLSNIENTVKQLNPGYPFDYRFLDEDFSRMYSTEERLNSLVRTFTFLAIFVSCLGLFGLASYMAERRTKEIGIRKVLGATVTKIVYVLTHEFFILVIIANVIAWPFAYFVMHKLLQNFAYRVNLNPLFFLFSGMMTLAVALLTVSYQSIKAALLNPVDSLRYE